MNKHVQASHIILSEEVNKHNPSLCRAAIHIRQKAQAFPPPPFKENGKEYLIFTIMNRLKVPRKNEQKNSFFSS